MRLAAILLALLAAAPVGAAPFPVPGKPLRIVVGFAAGGGTDIMARQLAPRLSDVLGVPVVIENRPGASTALGALEVARSAPDGHTVLYTFNGTFTQNPHTIAALPYDAQRDFTPISLAARGPLVLVAHVSLPVRDVRELVAYGRANPGVLSYASFGIGTSSHLFGELLARQSGVPLLHVPYKGAGDAAKDLLAGRVPLMFDSATSALPQVKAGRLRALAVVAERRSPFLPDVPTFAEQGIAGIDLSGWLGFWGPAGLPPEVVAALNVAIAKVLAMPELREQFAQGAYEAAPSTPAELDALVRDVSERWARIVNDLGVKPQ
ncbi:MAG TPA: tripartite tricarboxylate transporter substrate binding protein [Casimicrobiaceae bacterium]